jgi:dynein heavy chain
MDDIASKLGEDTRGPFQNSFMQECEYMNILIHHIIQSLRDIELAFKGELTMTENMEKIMNDIHFNKVPALWTKYGFTSTRG